MALDQRALKGQAFYQLRDLIKVLMEAQPFDQTSQDFRDWEKLSEKTLELYEFYKEILGGPHDQTN